MDKIDFFNKKQKGNQFQTCITYKMDKYERKLKEITSENCIISGLILLQVKVKYITDAMSCTFVKFSKAMESDQQDYVIRFRCSGGVTEIYSADNHWHHIDGTTLMQNISVAIELFTPTGLFSSLHEDTELTDFEICTENGSIKVHKAAMAGCSPVLRTMFTGQWKEVSQGAVHIPNTTLETLQHLKDYVYLQKLPDHGIEELVALASYYMMVDLKEKCAVKLLLNLSADNVFEVMELGKKYDIKMLFNGAAKCLTEGCITAAALVQKYFPAKNLN